jgi:hypothetical protein
VLIARAGKRGMARATVWVRVRIAEVGIFFRELTAQVGGGRRTMGEGRYLVSISREWAVRLKMRGNVEPDVQTYDSTVS